MRKNMHTYLALLIVTVIALSSFQIPVKGSVNNIEPKWENTNRSGGEVYIQDDYVVVTSNLKCFDKNTGDIVWDDVVYGDEVITCCQEVFDVVGGIILARYDIHTVLGISTSDGKVIWSYEFKYNVLGAKATEKVLICSFNISSTEYPNTPKIVFIDLGDGQQTWYSGYGNYESIRPEDMFISGDKCYLSLPGVHQEIVCIDTKNAKELWHKVLYNSDYSPILIDDKIYYLSDDTLYSLDSRGTKYEVVSGIESHGVEIVDVTAQGVLTISYDPGMYFMDYPDSLGLFFNSIDDGRLIWKYEWDPYADTEFIKSIISIPYVFDGFVYMAGMDSLSRIDLESGMHTLVAEIPKNNTASRENRIKISDDRVYVTGRSGISCYNLSDINNFMKISYTFQINKSMYSTSNGITRYIDVAPVIKDGRTLLPARYVVEPLGGQVFWDGDERKVTCKLVAPDNTETDEYKENVVELWIDKPTARINGVEIQIDPDNPDIVPTIINDRTMVPMRFLAESLGCEVEWGAETKEIILTYTP